MTDPAPLRYDKVAWMAAQLEDANAELTRANSDLGQFVTLVAHDLKAPLQSVLGFAELLQRMYGDQLDDIGRECVDTLRSGATRMAEVIDGVLAYSRTDPLVDRGPLDGERSSALNIVIATAAADPKPIVELLDQIDDVAAVRLVRTPADLSAVLIAADLDCLIVDASFFSAGGTDILDELRITDPSLPVIIRAGPADNAEAIGLARRGADDVITDVDDATSVARTIRYAVGRRAFQTWRADETYHDTVTGLPNATLLVDRLQIALARVRRSGTLAGLFHVTLPGDADGDRDDAPGAPAQEELLRDAAARLRAVVRPYDTVAYLGGLEFALLCEGDRAHLMAVPGRLSGALLAVGPTGSAPDPSGRRARVGWALSDGDSEPARMLSAAANSSRRRDPVPATATI